MSAAAKPSQRIGVFGGAFDPPHTAHVALARAALSQLQLDTLHIVPTGQAWHKQRTLSAPEHRLHMAELAFGALPGVVVDRRELERSGASYTVDTLEALKAENPESQLYLILGGDQWQAFKQWHRWEAILRLAIICVADRADPERASGTFNAQNTAFPGFVRLELPLMAVSATDIRGRIAGGAEAAQDIAQLVPSDVARYISLHGLYSAPNQPR